MFTIDLLKGQNVPIKSRPEGIAIAAVTFAVPVIIAMVMFGFYLRTKIVMSVQKQGIINYDKKIAKLSDAVELQKSFEDEKNIINSNLSEVASAIGRHTQWSPVLVTLVKNLPDSVVLTKLEVKQKSIRRRIPKKDDPQQMIDVSVPVRTLQINICGSSRSSCDKAVKDFGDSLRLSTLLGPKIEDIKFSQGTDKLDGRDVVSYKIDCILKPEL